jgi:hypothetical protein
VDEKEHTMQALITASATKNTDLSLCRFLLPWLCAAALVVVLRFLSAVDVGYDLTWQLQAAQHLLAGKGLSVYWDRGLDLAEPLKLVTLTAFACGYSVFAAALIALGASVGVVVKVLGAVGSMLGWWGWGKLAYPFFREGLQRSPVWQWAGLAIAMVSPLFFTPPWGGTDIFLWAAVPWVVDWVVRAGDEHVPGGRWLDGLAGALCGLCVLMRYASLFLVLYAAGLILWQSRMRLLVLTRRWACFGLGLLPALALQGSINYSLANAPATPGGLTFDRGLGGVVWRAWDGVPLLSTVNYPWVFWLPGRVGALFSHGAGAWPWPLGITVAVLVLLVLVAKLYGRGRAVATQDPRTGALGLFVVLPLVLWGCMIFGAHDYVANRRYYWPLLPLSVFVVYSLASLTGGGTERSGLSRILHIFGVVYLTGYLAMSLAYLVFLFVPGELGSGQRAKLMGGSEVRHWPSMAVAYEFSPARRFVMALLQEQSDTWLWTSKGQWFYADSTVDQARLFELTAVCQAKSLSGPARIVILTFDDGGPQELWNYAGDATRGWHQRVDCFDGLLDLHLLQRFPEEGVKILEMRVPADRQVMLGSR